MSNSSDSGLPVPFQHLAIVGISAGAGMYFVQNVPQTQAMMLGLYGAGAVLVLEYIADMKTDGDKTYDTHYFPKGRDESYVDEIVAGAGMTGAWVLLGARPSFEIMDMVVATGSYFLAQWIEDKMKSDESSA